MKRIIEWWKSLPYSTRAALVWAVAGVVAAYITWKHEVGKPRISIMGWYPGMLVESIVGS